MSQSLKDLAFLQSLIILKCSVARMDKNTTAHHALKLPINMHILNLPWATCGTALEIYGFAGLSQVWELHFMMPDVKPLVLSRLCVFHDNTDSCLH